MVRIKSLVFLIVSIFVVIISLCVYNTQKHTIKKINQYEVQFAYPVTSINPVYYDDWESMFIGNHIYYRLLPEENKPWIPYITKNISISCHEPISSLLDDSCKIVRISFKPAQITDCLKRVYTINDIRHEFELILKSKGWVVPQWKRCSSSSDDICVEGKYVPDQIRRMRATYFRFGWSKANANDKIYGASPYCLHGNFDTNGSLKSGTLVTNSQEVKLPFIKFHTSQSKDDEFQLAIYGNKGLLTKTRKNIQVHTPLAYYVVTNPALDRYDLPWNTEESKRIIHDFLTEKDMFFSEVPQFVKFASEGNAINKIHREKYSGSLEFMIPNYLPGCDKLAYLLNEHWGKVVRARAVCTDIVDYVYKNVVEKKKSWNGFFVGVSAGDPSRDSLRYQYFSTYSPSSWTYDHAQPENLYYLVGIGQSLATVDGEKTCNIRPNPLGLSDIFITDLLPCGE